MSTPRRTVYTVFKVGLAAMLFLGGCGAPTSSRPADGSSDATRSAEDPEVPTVTLPGDDAGQSESSSAKDGSAQEP